MDLTPYKLTLPIAADAKMSGPALEVQGAAIAEGVDYFWFKHEPAKLTFRTPDYGATTQSTTSPRSELRHMTDFAVNQPSQLAIKSTVLKANPQKNLTIMQIHGGSSPWVKISYKNGLVRALVKPLDSSQEDTKIILAQNVPLGQAMNIGLAYNGQGLLTCTLDGYSVSIEVERTGTYFYKHGAYPADSSGTGFVYEVINEPTA